MGFACLSPSHLGRHNQSYATGQRAWGTKQSRSAAAQKRLGPSDVICACAQHGRLWPGVVQPELRVWAAAGADEPAWEAGASQQRVLVRRSITPAMHPSHPKTLRLALKHAILPWIFLLVPHNTGRVTHIGAHAQLSKCSTEMWQGIVSAPALTKHSDAVAGAAAARGG